MSYVGKVDLDGTQHLVANTLYGTCSSNASEKDKVVTLADYDELMTGTMIQVKFTNTNTAVGTVDDPITLNVNGTGAKTVYKHGNVQPGATEVTSWKANSIVSFVYDGTNWMMIDVNPVISEILKTVYPVGAIYISTVSTDPGTLFGGTWSQIKGRFLLAAGSNAANTSNAYGSLAAGAINRTAGEKGGVVSHTLTTGELPAHTHGSKTLSGSIAIKNTADDALLIDWPSGIISRTKNGSDETILGVVKGTSSNKASILSVDASHEHTTVGSGESFSIMPPYLVVYVWKRVS